MIEPTACETLSPLLPNYLLPAVPRDVSVPERSDAALTNTLPDPVDKPTHQVPPSSSFSIPSRMALKALTVPNDLRVLDEFPESDA